MKLHKLASRASSAAPDIGPDAFSQRMSSLEVRLATCDAEIEAAQALRYRVFYQEMAAKASPEMERLKRDFDKFDTVCDHLLVIDHNQSNTREGRVVGTYRLIRRSVADTVGHFYSAGEYDISALLDYPGEILELGRSCVDAAYRNAQTMLLLWRGIAGYINQHEIQLMFGCASLPGTDPQTLSLMLSYLYYFNLAPPALRPVALPSRYVDMRVIDPHDIDIKEALSEMPPLIKGYLRLGGFVGDGAVVDNQFNTTDVCVIVKSDLIVKKYARHYELTVRAPPFAHVLEG
jgi:putative hemolysin